MLYNFTVIYNGILLPKIWVIFEHAQTVDSRLSFPRLPEKEKESLGTRLTLTPTHTHTCMYMCMYIVHTGTYTSVYARTHVHVRVIERTAKRVRISSYIVHPCTSLLFTNQVHVRHSPMVVMIAHLLLGSVHSENSKLAFSFVALTRIRTLSRDGRMRHVIASWPGSRA